MKQNNIKKYALIVFGGVIVSFVLVFYVLAAWQEPKQIPPEGNVPVPINAGPVSQIKEGDFTSQGKIFAEKFCFPNNECKTSWQSFIFAETFGGVDDDIAYSAVQTSDGGYIVAGSTKSFGLGGYDIWLVKLDPSGNKEWDKTFGGAYNDESSSVIQSSDGSYVLAGYTYSDGKKVGWLLKLDQSGNKIWDKNFPGANLSEDVFYSVIQDSDGNYVAAGHKKYADRDPDFDNSTISIRLLKTDSNGNSIWEKEFAKDRRTKGAYSVIQSSDGGYVLFGDNYNQQVDYYCNGYPDVYFIKTDENGNEEYSKRFGTELGDDIAYFGIEALDKGFLMAGYSRGCNKIGSPGCLCGEWDWWEGDFTLVKTDINGEKQWSRALTGNDDGWTVKGGFQFEDGGYFLVADSQDDAFLFKTNSSGNEEWRRIFGGSSKDSLRSIFPTNDGGFLLAGYTSSYGAGKKDFWIIKTDEFGNTISRW